ncbi:hypothetical protein GCM10009751_34050 [Myceligenerans crystallogenes]|uniref:Short C-terminal domain-containing protein n=1 Tax=Myceligenerans crystallogenes TaxID=316335 RepID=A0ABN2NJK5_9MICO
MRRFPPRAGSGRCTPRARFPRSVADRLADVDRLHAEGAITDTEREAQRGRILGEV